jgi:hypothetical protein
MLEISLTQPRTNLEQVRNILTERLSEEVRAAACAYYKTRHGSTAGDHAMGKIEDAREILEAHDAMYLITDQHIDEQQQSEYYAGISDQFGTEPLSRLGVLVSYVFDQVGVIPDKPTPYSAEEEGAEDIAQIQAQVYEDFGDVRIILPK